MQRSDVEATGTLESYFARLERALAPVHPDERREILLETRSHVAEQTRRAPWRTVESVLAELGPAEEYARQFLAEEEPPAALAPPAAVPPPAPRFDALQGIARLATGGIVTLPLLGIVVTAYTVAILAFGAAMLKLVEPDSVGLWIDGTGPKPRYTFGVMVSPPGREVLGHGFTAIMLVIATGIHLTMSALMRRLLKRR